MKSRSFRLFSQLQKNITYFSRITFGQNLWRHISGTLWAQLSVDHYLPHLCSQEIGCSGSSSALPRPVWLWGWQSIQTAQLQIKSMTFIKINYLCGEKLPETLLQKPFFPFLPIRSDLLHFMVDSICNRWYTKF